MNANTNPPPLLPPPTSENCVAWIGLDWGHTTHAFAWQDRSGHVVEGTLPHSAENLHAWLRQLAERFGGQPGALGIEASRGPVIAALRQYPGLTIYPINPSPVPAAAAPSFPPAPRTTRPTPACCWNWCAITPPNSARSNRRTS